MATAVSTTARRARVAVAVLFCTNGALWANFVPRYPEIKAELALSNTILGVALAAFPLGALVAGPFAPLALRALRSGPVASFGIVAAAATIILLPLAPNWIALAAVLFAFGAIDSLVDIAQNAHGLRVQRQYKRSIVNSFHGVWAIGAAGGGLMGSAAAGLRLPLLWHLGASALLFSLMALAAIQFLLPGADDAEREPATGPRPRRTLVKTATPILIATGTLALCGALVEDAAASWGAIYLSENLDATPGTAGLAFVSLMSAMTVGRLLGDRLVDRFGQRTVVRVGALLTAVGMGAALAVPTVATTLIGFALAGLGVATLVPAALHTADEIPGLPSGAGIAVVNWVARVGFLFSPPLVGLVADATSLRVGLLSVVIAGVTTAILGRVLTNR